MKTKTQRYRSGSAVGWRKKATCGQLLIALCVSATFGCRTSDERARAEMQPAYRSAKLMMERMKAGADFKEFNTLRGNFATELSIIRDRMNSGASTKEPLRRYYAAYQDVLELYSFAASAWEEEMSFDECTGPAPTAPTLDWAKDSLALEKGRRVLEELNAWNERFHTCFERHSKTIMALVQQAASPRINCPGDTVRLDCVFKTAETRLTSAEALLLKH